MNFDPLFTTVTAVAGAFYGSICSYAFFGDFVHTRRNYTVLCTGAAVGAALSRVLIFAAPRFVEANEGAIVAASCGANLWLVFLGSCYLLRDRQRGQTLTQAYLEATADGLLVVNIPVTAAFCVGAHSLYKAVAGYFGAWFVS